MFQGILSSGIVLKAIGYHFGEFVDQTPYIFLLITFFVDFPVRRLIADITVVTNRIVVTHGTVRKSLTIKTGLFGFCFHTLFLHRFPTMLRRRRSDGLRSTIEIILVTGMVISVPHTLFTDSLLALVPRKVLVADF